MRFVSNHHRLIFIAAIRCSAEQAGPHWATISPSLKSLTALFTCSLLCLCRGVCVCVTAIQAHWKTLPSCLQTGFWAPDEHWVLLLSQPGHQRARGACFFKICCLLCPPVSVSAFTHNPWYPPLTDPAKKARDEVGLTKVCRRRQVKKKEKSRLPGRFRMVINVKRVKAIVLWWTLVDVARVCGQPGAAAVSTGPS